MRRTARIAAGLSNCTVFEPGPTGLRGLWRHTKGPSIGASRQGRGTRPDLTSGTGATALVEKRRPDPRREPIWPRQENSHRARRRRSRRHNGTTSSLPLPPPSCVPDAEWAYVQAGHASRTVSHAHPLSPYTDQLFPSLTAQLNLGVASAVL